MKAKSALTLALAAGVCSTATADITTPDVPAIGVDSKQFKSAGLVGHYYIKVATGEMVFTPAKEYLANKAGQSFTRGAVGDDINGDGFGDVWINTNGDPCPLGSVTTPNNNIAAVDNETTQGDYHLYKGQIVDGGTDLLVETLIYSHWTDILDTDTNSDSVADGNTRGHGFSLTFYDKEDFFGKVSCFCASAGGPGLTRTPVVTLSATNLPGPLTAPIANYLSGFVLTFDLSGGSEFELADTDGVGPASGFFNSMIAANDIDTDSDTSNGFEATSADTDSNGQIDISWSVQAIQPTAPNAGEGLIGYQLAAPGAPGTPGVIDAGTGAPISGPVGADDGVIDYGNRTDGTPPLQWSQSRIVLSSIQAPMGRGSFPFTSGLLAVPSTLGRFSLFFASLGESPDPAGPPPISPLSCAGLPNGDTFGWGATHPPDGTFYGDLNCQIDDDGDTVPDGRPWSSMFMALSGAAAPTGCTFADCDGNGMLNVDDIDCFVAAFLGGDLVGADCDGNLTLNVDDIDCFVASFLGGCP
ncbi:MAG: hypothetical protein DHS20C14_21600 [Phycisphaeraceae bacterium]|nr:MAG: hypothetical protein DHS20C14_21600 [Phycisphaeraceae bacterium]